MGELVQLISEVGFPIIITLYLLHRMERKLDDVIFSIERLQSSFEVAAFEKSDHKLLLKQVGRK